MVRTVRRRIGKRRLVWAIAWLAALVSLIGVGTGASLARMSNQAANQTSGGISAATLAAPTAGSATSPTTSSLVISWTASTTTPPSGSTLSYTVLRCVGSCVPSAAASAACTGVSASPCTDSGLAANTTYTYSVRVALSGTNWTATSTTFTGTTSAAAATVGATLLKSATDTTANTSSSTVTSVTATNGATVLILIYRDSSASNPSVTSINSGAGTPFSSVVGQTPQSITSTNFASPAKYLVAVWRATGTGSSGTVTVNFDAAKNNKTVIDVVELSGNDTSASLVAHQATNTGNSATASSGTLTGASSTNGEIFFAGVTTGTTMSLPTGFTALDAPSGSIVSGSWFKSAAQTTAVTTSLGASREWGAVALEITHA